MEKPNFILYIDKVILKYICLNLKKITKKNNYFKNKNIIY